MAIDRAFIVTVIINTAAVDHPNTVRLRIGNDEDQVELVCVSIGGGQIEITELTGFQLCLSGHHPALFVMHNDRFGAIASVTSILAKHKINIGHMEVNRKDVGKDALMVIETDQNVEDVIIKELMEAKNITHVSRMIG